MCSIEAFLQHAKLHDRNTGAEINHPTVAQLPTGINNDGRYWLILEDGYKGGDLATAKAYVHAYWKPGMSWTDLQFWFFYAYNGPGTAHINGLVFDTIAHSGDPNLAPLGEQFGDWECCMIRIDNSSKQMILSRLADHPDYRGIYPVGICQR
jgi:VPS62-like protein